MGCEATLLHGGWGARIGADARSIKPHGRCETDPHEGHAAVIVPERTVTLIMSSNSLTLSTTNPHGTRDEISKLGPIALIPPLEAAPTHQQISSNLSQMGYSAGRGNPSFGG
jgi:hypothetical protein